MGANAQTTVPTFTASQILTADQQNQSARTGVPVFATTTTRDAGFGGTGEKTLAEGQLAYVEGTGLQTYNGTSWVTWGAVPGVVQVKSTTKSDTFTMAGGTFTDVTGLSISITPTSASNKILIIGFITFMGESGVGNAQNRLMRDSTAIAIGDTAGSRTRATGQAVLQGVASQTSTPFVFLDSPATTSATTYKVQVRSDGGAGGDVYVNRNESDTDTDGRARTISTITVIEVAP